jgi:rare lipoprotein A
VRLLSLLLLLLVAACGSTPPRTEEPGAPEARPPGKGGYYKDDGPGENVPPNLASIPDAVPRVEPPHRFANRPYNVFGKDYVPISLSQPYREQGMASWYGKKFHGQKTSSGEVYDMYAMTAAHKTLPIPSYARVTNLANGKSVVVRINDRGPFHSDRIIDLSYAAAYRLGYVAAGSARVEVESVNPETSSRVQVAAIADKAPEKAELDAKGAAQAKATVEAKATYIQVGAFSVRENAEDLKARVIRELAGLSDAVQVLLVGNLWRLQVGPYRSSDDARSVASRIENELNLKPLLVTR